MSYDSLLIHTIEIFNPDSDSSGGDRYGNVEVVFDEGTETNARVVPGVSNEDIIDRDTRVTRYTVFLPLDTPISALSYIAWDGHTLRVSGEPVVASDRHGPHHTEAICEEVQG